MSLYCIGDLHGRYDLFISALESIDFNYEKDRLYILGDVKDVNYGAIEIFNHIMQYPGSFEFILGNHEMQFLYMIEAYDTIMLNDVTKMKFKNVMGNYLDVYDSISELIESKIKEKDSRAIRYSTDVNKWLISSNKRLTLLDAVIDIIEHVNYDEKEFSKIQWVLSNTSGHNKTKQFVKELLEIDTGSYLELKKYLLSKGKEIKFILNGKEFWSIHCLPSSRNLLRHISSLNVSNQYVIFGHEPITRIHNGLSDYNFDFNFREVLSYIDRYANHYYNLDMTDNAAAVLRLDDFEEFYVMKHKKESKSEVKPPTEPVNRRKAGYKIVNSCFPVYASRKGFSFITYKDYCMEYLIGVNKIKKVIYYKRADYMDLKKQQVIEGWYDIHTIEEIIEKVKLDYDSKRDTVEIIQIEKYLRGLYN